MAELVRVRGLSRQGIRLGGTTVRNNTTVIIDLDDGNTRKAVAHHTAIGQLIVVGDAPLAVASGVVVTNGTTTTYSVSAGTLTREDGQVVTVSAVSNQAITAPDGSNPRIDLVSVSPVGAIVYSAGTAAATPLIPVPAVGNTVIARLAVAAGATTPAGVVITDVAPRLGVTSF